MKFSKTWPVLVPGLLLLAAFAVALVMRVALPYKNVFTSDGILFTGNDAYYHMRIVEGFLNNFPHFNGIDPYFQYPGTTPVTGTFFQWLLGTVVWIAGLGSPSEHLLNVIGAYFPAVLGALVVVPTFFIARALWAKHGAWAGVIAAFLVALLPGEFLGRSILGFTDQHVAETLFSTTAVMFLILAVKSARLGGLIFKDVLSLNWSRIVKPLLFAALSGLFLGLYISSWQGALLVVFAFAVFFIVQFVIDHLRNRQTQYLSVVGTLLFLISLAFLPATIGNLYAPSLVIATLIPLGLGVVSSIMNGRKLPRVAFPLALIIVAAAGLGLFYLVRPELLKSMLAAFSIFTPSGTLLATVEAQSIFTPLTAGGNFFNSPAWINFYLTLPFAVVGLVILVIHGVGKRGNAEKCAVVIWTLVMLVATIGQRRFAYYFAVNVALLAGYVGVMIYYLVYLVLERAGGERLSHPGEGVLDLDGLSRRATAAEALAPSKKRSTRRERQMERRREIERRRAVHEQTRNVTVVRDYFSFGLSVVLVAMALFSQLILFSDTAHGISRPPAIETAASTPYAPSSGWMKSLAWLKDNTPEPFGSSSTYVRNYPVNQPVEYGSSFYSVTAWWDYGYWTTYIGHRVPSANPSQDSVSVKRVANFLVAQDEASAATFADEMRTGYVMMDYQTAASKFWAVATWADKSPNDFFEVFWDPSQNQQRLYIYPSYYKSMGTRLYSFNGTEQAGVNPLVVEYAVRSTPQGTYKEVVKENSFATYELASEFLASRTTGSFALVGTDPQVTPVPLEALQHYRPVYATENQVAISSTRQTAEIVIFERTR